MVIHTTEAGTLAFTGDCGSATTSVSEGNNTITLRGSDGNAFALGTYSNCAVTVEDEAGNVSEAVALTTFAVVEPDTTNPVVTIVTPVATLTTDATPNVVINTTEAGTLAFTGDCGSATTSVSEGNNTITLRRTNGNAFGDGAISNCELTVEDEAGNISTPLDIATFMVDTGPPVVTISTQVFTPTTDTTPNVVINTTEAGTLAFTGNCGSATTSVVVGNNTITLRGSDGNEFELGLVSNCALTVEDAAGNVSSSVTVANFTIAAACASNEIQTMHGVFDVAVGAQACTDYAAAITASNMTEAERSWIPGYAYAHYYITENATITSNNSRLALFSDYISTCTNTTGRTFTGICGSGDYANFLSESIYNIPVQYECDGISNIKTSLESCLGSNERIIIAPSNENLLGDEAQQFDHDYLQDKNWLLILQTGNNNKDNPNQGDTDSSNDCLEGYRCLFVPGFSVSSNNGVVGKFAGSNGCKDYTEYCIAGLGSYSDFFLTTNFASSTGVAATMSLILHRWPTLWPVGNDDDDNALPPEALVKLVLGCAQNGDHNGDDLAAADVGQGYLSLTCLLSPDGTLVSTPPTFSNSTEQVSGDEVVVERLIPTTQGTLYLEGVSEISELIGYDSYGRDFNVTPNLSTPNSCDYFEGIYFNICGDTFTMRHKITDYLSMEWFVSNNGYNQSYGSGDLSFGDSVGLTFNMGKTLPLSNKLRLTVETSLTTGEMVNRANNSYLNAYRATNIDMNVRLHTNKFSFHVTHTGGTSGYLEIDEHRLDLTPRTDTIIGTSYNTKL